jgi:hypothetical protein
MRRAALWLFCLLGLSAAPPQAVNRFATVQHPLELPLPRAAGASGGRIVVTVTDYTPSSTGPVTVVVQVRCGEDLVQIGRFGIMPQTAFSADDPDSAQQFGLPLRRDRCPEPRAVVIRLEPGLGGGEDARIGIGGVELR